MEQPRINEASAKEIKPFSVARYIENHSTLITLLVAVIGILGPAGYIVGIIYHQVYLSTFGLDSGFFPISAQDSYVYAYFVGTAYINKAISHLISFDALYVILGLLSVYIFLAYLGAKAAKWKLATDENGTQIRSFINALFQWLHPNNNCFVIAVIVVYESFYWLFKATYIALIFAVCWLLLFLGAYSQAKEAAQTSLDKYSKEGCTYAEETSLYSCTKIVSLEGTLITEGHLITSSANKVAIFNENGISIREVKATESVVRPRQLPIEDRSKITDSN